MESVAQEQSVQVRESLQIERHRFTPEPLAPEDCLCFVKETEGDIDYWSFPKTDDYAAACAAGRQAACDFIQYLADNEDYAGAGFLADIARGAVNARDSDVRGYAIGFFSFLERVLSEAAEQIDVYGMAELDRQSELAS